MQINELSEISENTIIHSENRQNVSLIAKSLWYIKQTKYETCTTFTHTCTLSKDMLSMKIRYFLKI